MVKRQLDGYKLPTNFVKAKIGNLTLRIKKGTIIKTCGPFLREKLHVWWSQYGAMLTEGTYVFICLIYKKSYKKVPQLSWPI